MLIERFSKSVRHYFQSAGSKLLRTCLWWCASIYIDFISQWRHNQRDGVSNHRRLLCLISCRFRRRSKKTSKLRVTDLCAGNSPVTGELRAQKASNAENVSIWWRHVMHRCELTFSCNTWNSASVTPTPPTTPRTYYKKQRLCKS